MLRCTFSAVVGKCVWSSFYSVLYNWKRILELASQLIKIYWIGKSSPEAANPQGCHPLVVCYPTKAVVLDRDGPADGAWAALTGRFPTEILIVARGCHAAEMGHAQGTLQGLFPPNIEGSVLPTIPTLGLLAWNKKKNKGKWKGVGNGYNGFFSRLAYLLSFQPRYLFWTRYFEISKIVHLGNVEYFN